MLRVGDAVTFALAMDKRSKYLYAKQIVCTPRSGTVGLVYGGKGGRGGGKAAS